ncbi:hypothetical protein AWV80_02605 [Cupriavidus sp. UYMU48A]|nr:hypothetical protein AWV80_02605 [Cupriavidus sp. UYMU48A]
MNRVIDAVSPVPQYEAFPNCDEPSSGNANQAQVASDIQQLLNDLGVDGMLPAPTQPQPQQMTAQSASGTLANYLKDATMLTHGHASLTANDLYVLSQNADDDVSQAATYMLQNPDIYRQIETHDVAGTDGKSGIGELRMGGAGRTE